MTKWVVRIDDGGFTMHQLRVLVDAFSTRVAGEQGAKITAQQQLRKLGADVPLDKMTAHEVE